jgi:hypothetical protein
MNKNIVFLLIPIIGFCQTSEIVFGDVMKMDNITDFKRVMMENGYDKVWDLEERLFYGYDVDMVDDDNVSTSKYGVYFKNENRFLLSFNKGFLPYKEEYDDIFEIVKRECDFVDIDESLEIDYIRYDCEDYWVYCCGELLSYLIGFGDYENELFIRSFRK